MQSTDFTDESLAAAIAEQNRWLAVASQNELLADGGAEQCPSCGAISAYAWQDVNYAPRADVDEGLPDEARIYHVGACSGFEWTCGACELSWTPEDSPLNDSCYTHSED